MNPIDLYACLPIATILILSSCAMLLEIFGERPTRVVWFSVAYIASWVAICAQYNLKALAFNDQLFVDRFSFIVNSIILIGALTATLIGQGFNEKQGIKRSLDYDLLISYSVIGAMVMANANNLILLFVGFELLSVCVYVLAAIAREERVSSEAGLKYFILGAFSSAFLLFGIALIYAATGQINISSLLIAGDNFSLILISGLLLVVFGFGFKVSLVPFHVWAPDVYQGAPTTVAAFMSTIVKTAALASFARFLVLGLAPVEEFWQSLVWALSAFSMIAGNLLALSQVSLKRMLAFSSIAHAGYATIGLLCGSSGLQATAFYLVVYTFMSLAAFGVLLYVTAGSDAQYESDTLESFNGLGWTKPVWGLVMLIAVLSLAGIPPMAGFMGKLFLFKVAVSKGYIGLAIIGALSSVVSLYYYLRIVVAMYFKDPVAQVSDRLASNRPELLSRVGLAFAAVMTVYLGIFPDCLLLITANIF